MKRIAKTTKTRVKTFKNVVNTAGLLFARHRFESIVRRIFVIFGSSLLFFDIRMFVISLCREPLTAACY